MNITKLLVIISWIYCIGYILFDYPMDDWYLRLIRGIFSTIFSLSILIFIFKRIDGWKTKNS